MRSPIAPLLFVLCVTASGGSLADSAATVVRVTRPTVIGYFPPVSRAELEDYSSGASSAVSHIQFALADTKKCLGQIKPVVRFVFARSVVLVVGAKRTTIELPTEPTQSYGAILAAPGREPRLIQTALGPSALTIELPRAAGEYFGVKACDAPL